MSPQAGGWSKVIAFTGNTLFALAALLLVAVVGTAFVWAGLTLGPLLRALYLGD